MENNQEELPDIRKGNREFTMVFDGEGVSLLKALSERSGSAASLFYSLLPHLDNTGAVVVSTSTLAQMVGKSESLISRWLKMIEEVGLIRRGRTKGLPVIAVNPQAVWRSWDTNKQYASFYAKVITTEGEIEDMDSFRARRSKAITVTPKRTRTRKAKTADPELPPPVGSEAEKLEILTSIPTEKAVNLDGFPKKKAKKGKASRK